MTKIGDAKRKLHGKLTGRPDNFSWLIEGEAVDYNKQFDYPVEYYER